MAHITDATALSAAECLLKHFGRSEAPHQLRSDNGPHFIADLIQEFLHLNGVSHTLKLAYSKQEYAIVERNNKESDLLAIQDNILKHPLRSCSELICYI